jgi:hypothetical protein
MKGTQTVFARHPLVCRLGGAVQRNAKPNFHQPSRYTDFVDDEAEEFLTLGKIQLIDSSLDRLRKTEPARIFRRPQLLSRVRS